MLCCKVHSTPLPPRLTKSSGDDLFYVSFCIGVSIRIGREIRCLPYAGFFFLQVKTKSRNIFICLIGFKFATM